MRIEALRAGRDATLEVDEAELRAASGLRFTSNSAGLAACNVYIVIVPTPVVAHERPDLWPLPRASGTVGQVLGKGGIVIDESTVYAGATGEDCVPGLPAVKSLFEVQALARAGISAWRL